MSEPFTLSQLKKLLATPQPPELGPGPRTRVVPQAELQAEIDRALDAGKVPPLAGRLIRATVLLWHDHLDAAHVLAQEIETSDGSYVHAIMRRRARLFPGAGREDRGAAANPRRGWADGETGGRAQPMGSLCFH